MPVVCCGLHSQVAPVVAGIGAGVRVAFAQLAGGALPVALSDTVRLLKTRRLLETAIAVAPCLDGDVQAVTRCIGADVGEGQGLRRRRLRDRARHRRDRLGVRSRWPRGRRGGERDRGARRPGGRRRPLLGRRPARAASRRLAPHALGASARARLARRGVADRPRRATPTSATSSRSTSTGWQEACASLPLDTWVERPDDDPWFFAAAFAAGRHARALLA